MMTLNCTPTRPGLRWVVVFLWVAAGTVALAPEAVEAQSRLTGVVVDGETGAPISGAYIVLQGLRAITGGTNSDGGFTLTGMTEGTYTLSVRHLAYREVEQEIEVAGGGRVTRARIELLPRAVPIDPIIVEVEARPTMGPLAGVYDRVDHMRLLGQGRFFERAQLEEWGLSRVSEVVATLPGVQVNRGQILLDPSCRGMPLYYLDGVPLRLGNETIDEWVQTFNIEIVEVYRRVSEIPGEFGGSAAQCGVIAIWTRRGP